MDAPVEQVYEVSQSELLKKHCKSFLSVVSKEVVEDPEGVSRYVTGIPSASVNMVVGAVKDRMDEAIAGELEYFRNEHLPFSWFVDEADSADFQAALLAAGFIDAGVFRGVIGKLDPALLEFKMPEGCTFSLVTDEETMKPWGELVGKTFGMSDVAGSMYADAMWKAYENQQGAYHWIARKEGKIVSALTTAIEGDLVSFWTGATEPECRKGGISSALRRFALQHAVANGCRFGASYLIAASMAYGICQKLGFETKWRFHVFVSPTLE